MKQKLLLLTMLLVATATGAWAKSFTPEYVDLGLPSGTLWATCNVGATSPEQYGDRFAWGETTTKEYYGWDNYTLCQNYSPSQLTKYCDDSQYGYNGFTDGMLELLPEDDAATQNWGDEWCTPTIEQFQELAENTNYAHTVINNVAGMKFTSKTDPNVYIFLPYNGQFEGDLFDVAKMGHYWSRTAANSGGADQFRVANGHNSVYGYTYNVGAGRAAGMSIRPVIDTRPRPNVILKANPEDGGTVAFKIGDVLINEDFESYTIDNKLAQQAGNPWTTWSNTPGGSEDGVVKGDADNKYGEFTSENDQVLLLGDKESGHYELSFDAYVPSGKTGYFNIQHIINSSWALQCYLNGYDTFSEGYAYVTINSDNNANFTCVVDDWMHFRIDINIDTDVARLYYTAPGNEEKLICEWDWHLGSNNLGNNNSSILAALNFWGGYDISSFRIDNICVKEVISEMDENGRFQDGGLCVVTATPNGDATFVGWEEDGEIVSTDQEYSFNFTKKTTLTANFLVAHDITFKPQTDYTIEGGYADVTVDDDGTTIEEGGIIKKVKAGQKVKIATKKGYILGPVKATAANPVNPNVTLADAFKAGAKVKVVYLDGNSCTFTRNDDGTYTLESGTGQYGNNNGSIKQMWVENNKLYFRTNISSTTWDEQSGNKLLLSFNPSNNTYTVWSAVDANVHFGGIFVNGVDITSQLTNNSK